MAVPSQMPGGVVWPGCPGMVSLAPWVPGEGGGGKRGAQPAGTVVGEGGGHAACLLQPCPPSFLSPGSGLRAPLPGQPGEGVREPN